MPGARPGPDGGEPANHQIYFNRSTDLGATWLADDLLLELDPDAETMSLGPKLAGVGPDLFVAWYDSADGTFDIFGAASNDGGRTWSAPVQVNTDPTGFSYSARPVPAMPADAAGAWTGEVVVAWEDSRDGASDVYAAHSADGGRTFAPDRRVDTGDTAGESEAFEPRICAGAGEVYVVWHDARNAEDGREIFANHSSDGGISWLGQALRLDTDPPGHGNSLFLECVLADGTLHVAWAERRGTPDLATDVYHRTVTGGVPGPEVRLDVGTAESEAPSRGARIATDGATVVVAWEDGRDAVETGPEGDEGLYYNLGPIGRTFDAVTDHPIEVSAGAKADLDVAVAGGDLLAVWVDVGSGVGSVYFRRLPLAAGR